MIELNEEVEPGYWLSSIIKADYVDQSYLVSVTTYVRLQSGQRVMVGGRAKSPRFSGIPAALGEALANCKANVVQFQQNLANRKAYTQGLHADARVSIPKAPLIEGLDLTGIDL